MEKVELKNILSASFNTESWQRVLREVFGANKLHQKPFPISLPTNNKTESAFELGSINTADDRVVGIYLVNVLPSVWLGKNRVGLRQLLRNIYKYDVDGALIVFTQESQWRFSYVSQIRTEKGKLETEPKRFTYLFGPSESTRTAVERFFKLKGKPIYLNDLYDAFSVDKLNKDFFKAYKGHYEKFWKYLASVNQYREFLIDKKQTDLVKQEKPIRDFSKKLLGRIVFLQFLQKKGWMGVSISTKTWQNGDKRFIQTLFNAVQEKSVFHSTYLKTLFFETLNTKRPNDAAPKILGVDIKIPYLNGGLFDKDISYSHKIDFPEDYFFSLIDFFEQYNFTIDENDPYESEVGIDPEMLGHIFENLLEENREKGAFYTPKEIVHYMCQESLIEYLKSALPERDNSFVEQLVRNNQMALAFTNRSKAIRINELLQEIKICDPAIGSGAFPMGLLKEIFECRRLIYPYLKTNVPFDPTQVKKEIIQNNIYGVDIDPGAVDIARLRFWLALVVDELVPHALPNLDYKIMQGNSLLESYEDIDLSKVASLDESTVRVVNPQVNIFTGRVEDPQMQYSFSTESKKSIKKLIDQYFSEEDKEEKLHIHKAIDTIVLEHIDKSLEGYENQLLIEIATLEKQLRIKTENLSKDQAKDFLLKSKELKEIEKRKQILSNKGAARQQLIEFENTSARPYFLWHLFFMDVFKEGGFHIMIGNPPYIQMQKDSGTLSEQLMNAGYETYERTGDIYALFYELGFNKLRDNGTLTFITSSQWLRANYGKSLRKYFLKRNLLKLLTLGPSVFESAVVDTNILVANNRPNQKLLKGIKIANIEDLEILPESDMMPMPYVEESAWAILNPFNQTINLKLKRGKPIKDWSVNVYFGIKTGLNEVFIINEQIRKELVKNEPKAAKLIRPVLKGREILKYITDWEHSYIIFIPWHFPLDNDPEIKGASKQAEKEFSNQYPYLYKYFREHKEGLEKRNRAETGIRYEWYALQRSAATYRDEFTKEKIIWKRIGSQLRFSYSDKEIYCLDSTCIATGEKIKYLTALLNSKLCNYQLLESAPRTGMGDLLISVQALEPLVVYYPNKEEEKPFIKLVDKIINLKSKGEDTTYLESEIDAMVFTLYDFSEKEMLHVLDSLPDVSKTQKAEIQGYYRDIKKGTFKIEL